MPVKEAGLISVADKPEELNLRLSTRYPNAGGESSAKNRSRNILNSQFDTVALGLLTEGVYYCRR